MLALISFIVGRVYTTRSICDSDCIYRMTVVARTAHTITVDIEGRGRRTLRPRIYTHGTQPCETVQPLGRYSMAPVMSADRFEGWEAEAARVARVTHDASQMNVGVAVCGTTGEAVTLEGDTITIEALPLTTPDNVVDFSAARKRLRG